MKLAPLLTQYLYLNKRLDLPGIGSFFLDPSVIVDFESKHHRPGPLDGVTFESNSNLTNAGAVVEYIATKTGKMKALASSDLESHLQLARQFLNIGKPFLFEGIGSLVKMRSGEFVFTSGQIMPDKMRDYSAREISATSSTEDSFSNYKNVFSPGQGIINWSKPFIVLLMIAGVAFAIWGGYKVYKTTTASKRDPAIAESPVQNVEITPDTNQNNSSGVMLAIKKDSVMVPTQTAAIDSYKVVLEITNAKRASTRFAQLKSFQWKIRMETKDSADYKLYLRVPITGTDTTRLKDSLYYLYGKKVFFER